MSALSVALPRSARALRLEFKRNAVPYVLPLLAALFYFDTLRTADGYPPLWTLRASVIGDHMLFEFSAFASGLAAWAGSREGRRKTAELVATTAWTAWARLSVVLAATLGWMLLAFGTGVAVLYIHTATQATWGGPPLWPVAVGLAGVTVVTVIGFTSGALFPGRFTAPLVAIGVLVLYRTGFKEALAATYLTGAGGHPLLSPDIGPPVVDAGTYYHMAPDVPITQVLFMGGIAIALFGLLGLVPTLRDLAAARHLTSPRAAVAAGNGWLPAAVAVILVGFGVAASCTGYVLAGTAKPDAVGGWEIPALHSAASDRPVPVTPDCTSKAGFQVCVHPAFSYYLTTVAAALNPVAAEIAGLPGAPVGAREVASVSGGQQVQSGISGNPPVFEFTAEHVGTMFGEFNGANRSTAWREAFQQGLLDAFLAGPAAHPKFVPAQLGPSQQAVEDALLAAIGSQPFAVSGPENGNGQSAGPSQASISAAARRLGALSAGARHAWLAAHLPALQDGTITLAQIP